MGRGKPEKYIALAEAIRKLAEERQLKRGEALPPERQLAQLFDCSHLTVRKALHVLEQDNLIHKQPSRGNYLGPRPDGGGKSGIVGFIFPDDETYYYKLFAELEAGFSAMNLHPVVHITGSATAKEIAILDFLSGIPAAALIAVPNPACRERYRRLRLPAIFFDLGIDEVAIPQVISDDASGARAAVEYLYSIGHRRIAHIGGTYDRTSELRRLGYEEVLARHGIQMPPWYIKRQTPSREWGYYAARELLSSDEPPTAIFCGNDTIAAGVVRYCSTYGHAIPEACSVIGFGNTAIAEDLNLSSVSQHSDKIAAALVENLRMLLAGNRPPARTLVPTALVLRGSSAPVKKY